MVSNSIEQFESQSPVIDKLANVQVFGEISWLFTQSELHRNWAIKSLEQWVLPPILHQQFRLYRRDGRPVAFVSWAYLSDEIEQLYVRSTRQLHPKDWKSGERGWVIDFIAPFGDGQQVIRDLRNNIFANDVGRALRLYKGKPEMRIIYLHGRRAISKARNRDFSPTVELNITDT